MKQRIADALQILAGVPLVAAAFTVNVTVGLAVGAAVLFGAGWIVERS